MHVLAKSLNGGIYIHDIAILSEGSQLIRPPFNRVAVLDPRLHLMICVPRTTKERQVPPQTTAELENIYTAWREPIPCADTSSTPKATKHSIFGPSATAACQHIQLHHLTMCGHTEIGT